MLTEIVIDADSLMYASASEIVGTPFTEPLEAEEGLDELLLDLEDNLELMLKQFWYSVASIGEAFEVEMAIRGETVSKELKITPVLTYKRSYDDRFWPDNFRYDLTREAAIYGMDEYKANRKGMPLPPGLKELYRALVQDERIIVPVGCEADDYVVLKSKMPGVAIAAIDKDVLNQSSCICYDYYPKRLSFNEPKTAKEQRDFFFKQCIMGDSSDGLRGVFKVGKVGAEKLVAAHDNDAKLWSEIVKLYKSKGQTEEEALVTARCVNMHQLQPDNTIKLWEPPL